MPNSKFPSQKGQTHTTIQHCEGLKPNWIMEWKGYCMYMHNSFNERPMDVCFLLLCRYILCWKGRVILLAILSKDLAAEYAHTKSAQVFLLVASFWGAVLLALFASWSGNLTELIYTYLLTPPGGKTNKSNWKWNQVDPKRSQWVSSKKLYIIPTWLPSKALHAVRNWLLDSHIFIGMYNVCIMLCIHFCEVNF